MDRKNTLKSVSQKTGLSAHVLRAWEKRYGVVVPERTETNRRFYTDNEIKKLILLKKAVDAGFSIGSIKDLSVEKLQELILSEEKKSIFLNKTLLPEKFQIKINNRIEEFLASAEKFNSKNLQFLIYEIEDEFSQSVIIEEFILQILNILDNKRKSVQIEKITEQFIINELSFYIRQIINKIPEFDDFPLILTYSPVGGFFQIGSLISSAIAKLEKWRVCNLGENLNSSEIVSAVKIINPDVISINMIYPYNNPEIIKNELIALKSSIPENIKILLSGRTVWNYREEVIKIGGIFAGDTFAFRKELQKIKSSL